MIQLIIAGIWGCVVALGSAYGVFVFTQSAKTVTAPGKQEKQVEQIKSKLITIPLSKAGGVDGYMRVQFAFSVEKAELEKIPIKPDIILVDEAYRSMTEFRFEDPQRPSRAELTKITQTLKDAIRQRMGATIVNDVWIQDYSYVPSNTVRSAASK